MASTATHHPTTHNPPQGSPQLWHHPLTWDRPASFPSQRWAHLQRLGRVWAPLLEASLLVTETTLVEETNFKRTKMVYLLQEEKRPIKYYLLKSQFLKLGLMSVNMTSMKLKGLAGMLACVGVHGPGLLGNIY